jgi:hypothetical protein
VPRRAGHRAQVSAGVVVVRRHLAAFGLGRQFAVVRVGEGRTAVIQQTVLIVAGAGGVAQRPGLSQAVAVAVIGVARRLHTFSLHPFQPSCQIVAVGEHPGHTQDRFRLAGDSAELVPGVGHRKNGLPETEAVYVSGSPKPEYVQLSIVGPSAVDSR